MLKEIKDNTLYFDGCSVLELKEKYQTPLYVMSENEIRGRMRQLKASFTDKYEGTRIAYACKAFCSPAMAKICEEEGLCIDIVSGGELYSAIKAGFPPERIEFNGNNKLEGEIEMAIDYGVGRFIIDGLSERKLIEKIAKEKGARPKVLYRITPGVAADTHDFIVTGKKDSKFGIPLEDEVFYPEIKAAIDSPYVEFLGLHFHVGSQLFDNKAHLQALDIALEKAHELKKRFDFDIKELNIGGGFGATYKDEERKSFDYFLEPMMEKIEEFFKSNKMVRPAVVCEPGRSIVAESGMSLYTIGSIKEIKDVRKYVSIDGGMTDNIRPALYDAKYTGMVANRADMPCSDKVTICGKCCESGDILIKDIMIPEDTMSGDLFAIFSTGAYGFSMASNYNSNPVPPVVLVKDGKSRLIVKGQTYEDIFKNHII